MHSMKLLTEEIEKIVSRHFGVEKDISDASEADLEDFFNLDDTEMENLTEEEKSQLYGIMDSVQKIAEDISYSVQNMDEFEAAVADGGEYMVWVTAEDERVCPFCGPLDNKIISMDEIDQLESIPPAHVNCRCELQSIEEHYGELKPVK